MPTKKGNTNTSTSDKTASQILFFAQRSTAMKEISAKVFASHTPKTDANNLRKPKIAKLTVIQCLLDQGPVSQISHWIYEEGTEIMGLSMAPDYKKVEFIVTDIRLILKTLWLCANLITFGSPIQCVIFHAVVLLFSFGYCQSMIIGMKYEQVVVVLIHDKEGQRRLATMFTINCNKLRANTLEHMKGEKFQFTMTLLPYPLLCLTYLVCIVGIHFNVFKAGYTSSDNIFCWPNLENINYVHPEWCQDFLDKEICLMSYTSFWCTLCRILLVAGSQWHTSMPFAVHNFMASHTTKVFENNYQTEHVRMDLASKWFGVCGGGALAKPLFKVMHDLSKQNDSSAPIEATPEQKLSIESCRDVTERWAALETAKLSRDAADIMKANVSLDKQWHALYDLLLMDAQEKYFDEANRLRAEGKLTNHL
ncbi:hypothetical protein IW261DRAFT_1571801 [Armillaria novae-zelandiae]|uniref:Uncharacterized protein n=1 Tax=Armillaria novae-zelandiae TaxID=153914 RepID=A0AA39NTS7_9AGAR|nr:hypothetical protein IW261DRAFT_1571801 [Armillaria novae-zelandiae]